MRLSSVPPSNMSPVEPTRSLGNISYKLMASDRKEVSNIDVMLKDCIFPFCGCVTKGI